MEMLLKYQRTDGLIRGVFESVVAGMLQAQIVPDDPDYGYLLSATELSAPEVQREYYVREGMLLAKTALTLTAAPNPFPADGVTVCSITVTPFLPCTLLVDGTAQALTEADQALELTSDVSHVFFVALDPMATAWAEAITVEAE